ncbi:MAG: pectinesterase family protein, partial [Bacteroidetes bacterium]|nr:pectinesterase family protein [Bacteroidota bacterium]
NVPSNKPNIQLIGESVANVIVYYDDYAGKPLPAGGTIGTQGSASITINANDFVSVNITFANTFNYDSASAAGVSGTQAVAVVINADRTAFKNCRFIGMQDTLYTKGSGTPRHYFYKCYIDGIVDFIFGSSVAIYDSCVVYAKSRTSTGNSYITAANTPIGQTYGYLFKDCKIPANTGNTLYYLGRPWNNATAGNTAENKVVFLNTEMSSSINPLGWSIWDAGTITSMITNAEYKSKKFDGTPVDVSNRISWSKQFTNTDTVGYNVLNMFNGWNPCSVRTDFCSYTDYEPAISNLKGTKNAGMLDLSWNANWAMTGVTYQVVMSDNPQFSPWSYPVPSFTTTNDTTYNFLQQVLAPAVGTTKYYLIRATKGSVINNSDVLKVSNEPNINATVDSLKNFLQGSTSPSASQAFYFNATNLLDSVTIKPSANYEISLDNTIWINNTSYIKLTPTNNTLANTLLYVRLNAASAGTYNGNILFSTPNISSTTTKQISVSGITQSTPLLNFDVLQQWDLTVNNNDNVGLRATGLTATTPTLSRLNLSNGTQVPAVTAYSALYGQALAPSNAGDGMWTTASGGSGGNLNRTLYEQFTVKPDVNYSVRIDSLVALIGYYGSTSNTKIAVVYSKSNFTTDSANVTGGRDLSGITFSGTANGAFTTPIVVTATSNSGNTSLYAFALNAGNGVQINAGETLTVRIYLSCGSTSAGRYAVIKNVQAKGLLPVNLPLKFMNYQLRISNDKQVENIWSTSNEINVSHFNIQRSSNGKDFITIGKVKANNNSNNEYSFIDNNAVDGKSYYRVIAVDKDGKTTLSETKLLSINSKLSTINIYPNPATSNVNIECENAKQLFVIDCLGKTIFQSNFSGKQLIIDTKKFVRGIYNVQIKTIDGLMKNQKLIVQ